jgi:hypothetical protein
MGSQRQPEPGENIKGGTTPQLLGGVGAFVAPKKRGRGASQRTKKSCTNTSKKQLAQTARARRKPAHQKKTVQTRPKNSWHKTTKTARARRKPAHQKKAVQSRPKNGSGTSQAAKLCPSKLHDVRRQLLPGILGVRLAVVERKAPVVALPALQDSPRLAAPGRVDLDPRKSHRGPVLSAARYTRERQGLAWPKQQPATEIKGGFRT